MKSIIVAIVVSLVIGSSCVVAQPATNLPEGYVAFVGGALCGRLENDWVPGKIRRDGKFITLSQLIKNLKRKLRRATDDDVKRKLRKRIKKLRTQLETNTPICDSLEDGIVPPTGPQTPLPGATTIDWEEDFSALDPGDPGDEFLFFCPGGGSVSSIYGTFVYTADSGICYAAVHTGLISLTFGGNVKLRIKPGQDLYLGSLRNGINSENYRSWPRSFTFLDMTTNDEITSSAPLVIGCTKQLVFFRADLGTLVTRLCPANCSDQGIWGTDVYTDDSEVCTAAVHAGRISKLQGGLINARILGPQSSFTGSTRNGVTSNSYGPWDGSYSFE